MPGVSERSFLKSLELFSKQKGCVSSWIIHSPLPDRILYANCPIYMLFAGWDLHLHLLFYVVTFTLLCGTQCRLIYADNV